VLRVRGRPLLHLPRLSLLPLSSSGQGLARIRANWVSLPLAV